MTSPQRLSIRRAEIADLAGIASIDRRSFPRQSYSYWMFRQLLEIAGHLFLVGSEKLDHHPVGYVLGCIEADDREAVWMMTLAVMETHRRQGVGSALTSAFLEQLRRDSIRTCRLTVSPENSGAIALYQNHGWRTTAEFADYFGCGEDRLLMECQVSP
jgi:ribosomal-protein-alanine N-acetyltransferase